MEDLAPFFKRYGVSLLLTTLAFVISLLFWPVSQRFTFVLFVVAVMASAWHGGSKPAFLSSTLAALFLCFIYWAMIPDQAPSARQEFLPRLALFVFVGLLTSYLTQETRRAVQAVDRVHITLSSIGDAVILADVNGRISYLNPLAQNLTGWTDSSAADKPLDEVFRVIDEETRRPVASAAAEALSKRGSVQIASPALLLSARNKQTPIEGIASPVNDPMNQPIGVAITFRDISERRKSDTELRQTKEQFQAMAGSAPAKTARF